MINFTRLRKLMNLRFYKLLHSNSEKTGLLNIDDLFSSNKLTSRACKNIKTNVLWRSKEFISFDSMFMRIVQRPIQLKSLLNRYLSFSEKQIAKNQILREFIPGLKNQLRLLSFELENVSWVIRTFDSNSFADSFNDSLDSSNISRSSSSATTCSSKSSGSSFRKNYKVNEFSDSDSNSVERLRIMSKRIFPEQIRTFKTMPNYNHRQLPDKSKWKSEDGLL